MYSQDLGAQPAPPSQNPEQLTAPSPGAGTAAPTWERTHTIGATAAKRRPHGWGAHGWGAQTTGSPASPSYSRTGECLDF